MVLGRWGAAVPKLCGVVVCFAGSFVVVSPVCWPTIFKSFGVLVAWVSTHIFFRITMVVGCSLSWCSRRDRFVFEVVVREVGCLIRRFVLIGSP